MPAVEAYYELADGKAMCDYSFHAIITDPTEEVVRDEVPKLVDFGITSVKVSLLVPKRARADGQVYMTYPLMKLDDKQMLDILAAARQQGITTMVHAENSEIISMYPFLRPDARADLQTG
jgi:dihydropyrimidinase